SGAVLEEERTRNVAARVADVVRIAEVHAVELRPYLSAPDGPAVGYERDGAGGVDSTAACDAVVFGDGHRAACGVEGSGDAELHRRIAIHEELNAHPVGRADRGHVAREARIAIAIDDDVLVRLAALGELAAEQKRVHGGVLRRRRG